MAYAITIGGHSISLLNPNDLGFTHTSFSPLPRANVGRGGQQYASAPSVTFVNTYPDKLEKCPSTHDKNPPNDCGLVLTTNTLASEYNSQANRRGSILNAVQNLSDADSFSYAIDGATQLENYFLDMAEVFAQREAYARKLRGYSWGTKDKWRCCYSNSQLDSAINIAEAKKDEAWQDARSCNQLVKQIQALQSAVSNSTLTELEVEEQRAETNYQIAQTNQMIAKEGFITSQLALKEGSGKIVMVVLALVAAFLVYRFVIKR